MIVVMRYPPHAWFGYAVSMRVLGVRYRSVFFTACLHPLYTEYIARNEST